MLASIGRCLPTGSDTRTRPSSTSCISATDDIGLVIEAMLKIASFGIGVFVCGSRWPIASKYTSLPFLATATTAPGNFPFVTSACSTAVSRASLSEDIPTDSGVARGNGSAACKAEANTMSSVAWSMRMFMNPPLDEVSLVQLLRIHTARLHDVSALQIRVWRGTSEGAFQEFEVPRYASQTVLDVVTHIQRALDPTLAYRFACRVGMCRSCAMTVNGVARWTCRTHVDKVANNDRLEIAPLKNLPVIRDLVADMREFFDKWARARGSFEGTRTRKDDFAVVSPENENRKQ